jgi:hypothetical protein
LRCLPSTRILHLEPGSIDTLREDAVHPDPRRCLTEARDAYRAAVERRNALDSIDPGFVDASLEISLRWAQVRYWERRLVDEPLREADILEAGAGR